MANGFFPTYRVGKKVEVTLEEEILRDVWFPATVVEDLGNNRFLVEYKELQRVSIDHLHIRPSAPQFTVTSFGLLEKVDAFYDFGWWSGVITKKLTDSRYVVYFKQTNKVKEFSHLELRPHVEWKDDGWFTTRQRSKAASNDKLIKPKCKKLKLNGVPSKEVSDQSAGQTVDKTKRLHCGRKTPAKEDKSVDLKPPMITSARKKGKLSADSRGPKALHNTAGDLTLTTTTPNTVKGKPVTENTPSPVVIGLQCKALTASQTKTSKRLISKSPQNVDEPEAPQSSLLLASKIVDVQDKETDGNSSTIRKWGKTFRRQPTNRKTSVALSNQNGDASVKKQKEKSNTPAKGKRGRNIISLNIESSPQVSVDLHDSSAQIVLVNGTSDIVEKTLDLVSENQSLSRLFLASLESAGKEPSGNSNIPLSITNGDDQKPSFEKRSSFWETIGSMEAFRLFPQNPHFRPLDTLNESARERHAIYKMVDFSGVFENMCRLRRDHPRTEFQDQLEILLELETHGFDVHSLRSRLMEMLSCKDKREALETGSKDPEDHLEIECVKVQERKIHIMLIDCQINELREKRERLVKENEESTMNIAAWEKEVAEIEEAKCECDRKFYELANARY
ncbi:putative Agenet-like domain-containing protein [Helianthus annuus]|nr:putative Agenet-like domain-containing protein [Helianthus annuus]KAJ0528938.1 putative Agenet-like domain-containing protein [Helianthus annuus]KAJ0695854.1 putative Agenet-like domain-containing protein [Helianthus annuus]